MKMPGAEIPVGEVDHLPRWQKPEALLILMAVASPLAFATWMALINNFAHDVAGFDGLDIGVLNVAREIPGFLAFGAVWVLLVMREQTLAWVSLLFLGLGTAVTAEFPTYWGLMATTLVSSMGFHYYETMNQSLQLQWLGRERAPGMIGRIVSAGSFGSLVVFALIVGAWQIFALDYAIVYWSAGLACAALALFCAVAYPRFRGPVLQNRRMVLRRRYWLYYLIVLISGARRQIFVVFAPFMLVAHFSMSVAGVTSVMLLNYTLVMLTAPTVGRLIARHGEALAFRVEYVGLFIVFALYCGVFVFGWPVAVAVGLYAADHLLFALAIAQKTYFQKIADPADQAPTAAVSFTINHIAAVSLPAPLGLLWLWDPAAVFEVAAGLALVSLSLSFLVPRRPGPGNETVLSRPLSVAASATLAPGE